MSKYHCNGFEMIHWMSWKRLLKDVVQDETFQFQDELRSFILLSFWFDWFFFCLPRWFPCGSPVWFPVVFHRSAYCREGSPGTFLPPKTGGTFFFPPTRARAYCSVTQFASRNLGDGKYLEGFGRQMIIKLWSYIISKLTDFLLLCILKSAFFFTAKGPPHKWWRSMVSNANLDFG